MKKSKKERSLKLAEDLMVMTMEVVRDSVYDNLLERGYSDKFAKSFIKSMMEEFVETL